MQNNKSKKNYSKSDQNNKYLLVRDNRKKCQQDKERQAVIQANNFVFTGII